jgi:hypothetical protein
MNTDELKEKTIKSPNFWVSLGTVIAAFIAGDKSQGFTAILNIISSIFG